MQIAMEKEGARLLEQVQLYGVIRYPLPGRCRHHQQQQQQCQRILLVWSCAIPVLLIPLFSGDKLMTWQFQQVKF